MGAATWTTKVLYSKLSATTANIFFPTSSTCRIVGRTSTIICKLYLSSQLMKLTWILVKVRKDILTIITMLISTNRKVFLKKRNLSSLFFIKKKTIIIAKISSLLSLIFQVLTLILLILGASFLIKLSCITLSSLPYWWISWFSTGQIVLGIVYIKIIEA